MAMRLFTKDEFEVHLQSVLKLTKTDTSTDTTCFWKTEDGHCISVPTLSNDEKYPDYILDEIFHQLKCINGD